MRIEARLAELGLTLPPSLEVAGARLPFPWVRVRGTRVYVSGHGPQAPDGRLAQPVGKVGADLTVEQGYQAARLTALAILGSLQRELGISTVSAAGCGCSAWSTSRPDSTTRLPSSTASPT